MRVRAVVVPLAALVLVAGCGGSSKKKHTTASVATTVAVPSTSTAAASSGPAVLRDVRATPSGPVKSDVRIQLDVAGTPKDATLAALLSQPIAIRFSGSTDTLARKSDLAFTVRLGAANIEGRVRADGSKSWIQLADQWYELPASSSGSSTSADPGAILKAFGSPSAYFTSVDVVGDENVGDIAATHVRGAIDVAKLAQSLQRVAGSAASGLGGALGGGLGGGGSTTTPAPLGKLDDALKGSRVELWIGKADHQVHRATFAVDARLPASGSSGITGVRVRMDATALPTGPVSVSAPSGAKPASELQQALGTLLLPALAGVGSGS